MSVLRRSAAVSVAVLLLLGAVRAGAIELRVSREVIQKTLIQQLFSGPNGRYYVKGGPGSGCAIYVENPQLNFQGGRILVNVKSHAQLGKTMGGKCFGITLAPDAQVSVAPDGEGETIGYRDARVDRISDIAELNFILTPFLSRQLPSGMKIDAAQLLRKALADSTATSGFKVALDKLRIHSVQVQGDELVVDVDGDLSVR